MASAFADAPSCRTGPGPRCGVARPCVWLPARGQGVAGPSSLVDRHAHMRTSGGGVGVHCSVNAGCQDCARSPGPHAAPPITATRQTQQPPHTTIAVSCPRVSPAPANPPPLRQACQSVACEVASFDLTDDDADGIRRKQIERKEGVKKGGVGGSALGPWAVVGWCRPSAASVVARAIECGPGVLPTLDVAAAPTALQTKGA